MTPERIATLRQYATNGFADGLVWLRPAELLELLDVLNAARIWRQVDDCASRDALADAVDALK